MPLTQRRFVRAALAVSLIAAISSSTGVAAAQPSLDIGSGIVNLVDGQTVTLEIAGFEPNTNIIAGQCDAAIATITGPLTFSDAGSNCQLGNSVGSQTNNEGTYTSTFTFSRFVNPVFGSSSIDCAIEGACVLGATTYTSDLKGITFQTIPTLFVGDETDDAVVNPVTISLQVEDNKLVPRNNEKADKPRAKEISKGGLSITDVQVVVTNGQAVAAIEFACDKPMEVTARKVALKQKRKGTVQKAKVTTSDTVSCDGTGSIEVAVDGEEFRKGKARLQVILRGAKSGQKATWKTRTKVTAS